MKTDLATGPCPRVFRSSDRTNDLILLAKYEDSARARQLFQSAEFREATQRTGVTAPPEVTMAGQVHQVPAELVQASVWFESGTLPRTQRPTAQDHVLGGGSSRGY